MPQRKVRHALITYIDGERVEMAYRGQIVTLSDSEAERFDSLLATVPVDADLPRPGTLLALPESPTDEELVAWCLAASETEVKTTLSVRPELGQRIADAYTHVVDAREAHDARAKAISESASGAPAVGYLKDALGVSAMPTDGEATVRPVPTGGQDPAATPGTGGGQAPPEGAVSATGGPSESGPHVGDDTAALDAVPDVVKGTVDDVVSFVAENPTVAAEVLSAEKAHQALSGKQPRRGVATAVEAALSHN